MVDLEHLSADELAYHLAVLQQFRAAQAAIDSWSSHLMRKYALGPQDQVLEDGTLRRAETRG